MLHRSMLLLALSWLACQGCAPAPAPPAPAVPLPGSRVLLDAHNCYPEQGRWENRIERAFGAGLPLAIEQDLVWYTDPSGARSWSIISHGKPLTGSEPTLREHFFERVRPMVEEALEGGDTSDWPLVTLNLDFKTEEPEHLTEVWNLLGEYESWLTTAERLEDPGRVAPPAWRPILVLTGKSDAQQELFHDRVPIGGRLRLFGAVHTNGDASDVPPEVMVPRPSDNYRRWWNNSWKVVERGGQQEAGSWTAADASRLQALVRHAHRNGLWIRFYTLNGHEPGGGEGWNERYNFGSLAQARERWLAAADAGADFIATDQYEELALSLRGRREPR